MKSKKVIRGPVGIAREIDLRSVAIIPRTSGALSIWILELPNVHPLWNTYQLTVIHLRDIDGVKPAHKIIPGAEYEIMLLALNPEHDPKWDDQESWHFLTPPNFRVQFANASDELTIAVCELFAQWLVDGDIPADPEQCRGSEKLWQDGVHMAMERNTWELN